MNNRQYISRKKIFGLSFPLLKTTLLSGEEYILPNQFKNNSSVLYLAGPESNQTDLDSWSASIRKRFEGQKLNHLEVLFIKNQDQKNSIIKQLKKDIKSEFHHMIAFSNQSFDELKKTLLLVNPKDIFVFVLDEYGKIIFSAQGPADEFRLYRINKAIFNSLTTDQSKLRVVGKKKQIKKKVAFIGKLNDVSVNLITELVESSLVQEIQLILAKPSQFHHIKIFEQVLNIADIKLVNTIQDYDELMIFNVKQNELNVCCQKAVESNIKEIKIISTSSHLNINKADFKKNFQTLSITYFEQIIFLGSKSKSLIQYLKKLGLFAVSQFLVGKYKKFKPITAKKFAKSIISSN